MSLSSPAYRRRGRYNDEEEGRPLHLIERSRTGNGYELNDRELQILAQTLRSPRFANKRVAVISVAGAMRTGKSRLLNFFLEILSWMEQGRELDDLVLMQQPPLAGFSSRTGQAQDTIGVLTWSRPFLIRDSQGEELAVLLVDTQGSFDAEARREDNAALFAFSSLLASTQIFNVPQNLNESVLDYLHFFTQFGTHMARGQRRVYQDLLILVRDYGLGAHGFEGGNSLLNDRLSVTSRMTEDQREMRREIKNAYQRIECFTMPSPGQDAAEGRWDTHNVDPRFLRCVKDLISEVIFNPKTFDGQQLVCAELVDCITSLCAVLDQERMPKVESMCQAMRNGHNRGVLRSAIELFRDRFVRDANEAGADDANQHLRPIVRRTLRDGVMDQSQQQELLDELEETLDGIVRNFSREVHDQNGELVETLYRQYEAEIGRLVNEGASIANSDPDCRGRVLTNASDQLRGGPIEKRQAMETLERRMDDERRRLEAKETAARAADARQKLEEELHNMMAQLQQAQNELNATRAEQERAQNEELRDFYRERSQRLEGENQRMVNMLLERANQAQNQGSVLSPVIQQMLQMFLGALVRRGMTQVFGPDGQGGRGE